MTTNKKSKYEKDEDKLINLVETMLENYNLNLKEIFAILKDRI